MIVPPLFARFAPLRPDLKIVLRTVSDEAPPDIARLFSAPPVGELLSANVQLVRTSEAPAPIAPLAIAPPLFDALLPLKVEFVTVSVAFLLMAALSMAPPSNAVLPLKVQLLTTTLPSFRLESAPAA